MKLSKLNIVFFQDVTVVPPHWFFVHHFYFLVRLYSDMMGFIV